MNVRETITTCINLVGEDIADVAARKTFLVWIGDGVANLNTNSMQYYHNNASGTLETEVGVAEYYLPEFISDVDYFVRSDNQVRLNQTNINWVRTTNADLTVQGAPQTFWITSSDLSGYKVRLWPVPSGVYTYDIFGAVDPTALTEDHTVPLPFVLEVAVRNFALSSYYLSINDTDRSDRYYASYAQGVAGFTASRMYPSGIRLRMQYSDVPRNTFSEPSLPLNYTRSY